MQNAVHGGKKTPLRDSWQLCFAEILECSQMKEKKSIKNKKQSWYALFFKQINAGINLRKVQTQTR